MKCAVPKLCEYSIHMLMPSFSSGRCAPSTSSSNRLLVHSSCLAKPNSKTEHSSFLVPKNNPELP